MPVDRRDRKSGRSIGALLLRFGLYVAIIACALLAGYLLYLDRVISETFEGRRWSVPARIYAQPLEIYPGLGLSVDEFEIELKRLGYTKTGSPSAPGTFHRDGRVLDVWLRGFSFSDGYRPATRLRLRFARDRILSLDDESDARIPLVRLEPPQTGSFFASHGEDRLIVAPEDTPPLLTETLKVVEDRRFDAHPGFDLMGIARAFWTNLRAGEVQQGGSTLTQQLVKSFFLDNRRTLGRKLKELAMAIILELRFDKTDLMNAYINEIYLGQDGNRAIHGFGLASEFYFNKPLAELDPPGIALLVAIIRGPSYYNPYQHLERAHQRRDLILGLMRDHALIDQPTYQATVSEPPRLSRPARRGGRYVQRREGHAAGVRLVDTRLRVRAQQRHYTRPAGVPRAGCPHLLGASHRRGRRGCEGRRDEPKPRVDRHRLHREGHQRQPQPGLPLLSDTAGGVSHGTTRA